jgi:hypothetical protein
MIIMHVRMVEMLCQTVMGRAPILKYLVLGARGCLCYVLSCQALNGGALQGPGRSDAYPVLESPLV